MSVSLSPNTLYIQTLPLSTPGKFHWSLILLSDNILRRYQWAQKEIGSVDGEECEHLEILPVSALDNRHVLGYFALFPLNELNIENVFGKPSYPSAAVNRVHGMSCRTWILAVLAKLGTEKDRVDGIEKAVIDKSTAQDLLYARSLFAGVYHPIVAGV